MQLLWEEYQDECRLSNRQAYQLTQFKKYFREHLTRVSFTDIINHKAGERIEVDWAGSRPQWHDPDTGEAIYGWLFVGVLPFSQYGYGEVFSDMKLNSWIQGHINMFNYFGGVSKILVPDNLRTGVTKNTKDEIILNRTYSDMANYYGTIIIPTRIAKPKDKASAEGTVNWLTTNIIGRMRNYQFFTMAEYNHQLLIELEKINMKPFQKKEGSRSSVFQEYEKSNLIPLPEKPYIICEWKKAKVASNSHISLSKCYYSVPYQYIGETVNLRITANELQIYHNQVEISTFKLIKDGIGVYSTDPQHMPPNSNVHSEWNSTRYLNWAKQKGPFVLQVIQQQFDSVKVEQQKYRTVHSILKLADDYGSTRLNLACQYGLEQFGCPNYQNIRTIIVNKQDIMWQDEAVKTKEEPRFLRGAKYYE